MTLTCNTKWPEIEDILLEGQTAYDRPDVVCRVFKARLEALLKNLRSGKYFKNECEVRSSHDIDYLMHVIEYQHRGLPHAHIVVRLTNIAGEKPAMVEWIDKYISTTCPNEEENPKLHNAVKSFMIHKCSNAVNGCLNDEGLCLHLILFFPLRV
jgi:hypothetical protein